MKLCARKCKISLDEIYQSENFDPIGRNWKSVTDFCALIPTLLVRLRSGFEFHIGHYNWYTPIFPHMADIGSTPPLWRDLVKISTRKLWHTLSFLLERTNFKSIIFEKIPWATSEVAEVAEVKRPQTTSKLKITNDAKMQYFIRVKASSVDCVTWNSQNVNLMQHYY